MTTICEAIKKDGNPCKCKAKNGTRYCGTHKNYYTLTTHMIKVYYPSGKEVDVKYRKNMDRFKEQLDEYETNIVKIFIEGEEDEPQELPQHLEHVFCLLEEPRYLKVGFVAVDEREDGDKQVRIVKEIRHPNDWQDRIVFETHILSSTGSLINNLGKSALSINKLHTKFYTTVNTSLTPQEFFDPENKIE
jgi:hypothetical protein